MRRILKHIAKYTGIALAVLILLVAAVFGFLQTPMGRDLILAQIEGAMADGPITLQAAELEGVVPFDMQVTGVELSDRKGIWLTLDRLSLDWSPLRLIVGELAVADLHLGQIDLPRLPDIPDDAAESDTEESGPLIPSLPIDIYLKKLTVDRLSLGAPILGEAAVFQAAANASLSDIADGLLAQLTLQRLDGGNDLVEADIAYRPDADALKLALAVHEPRGGLLTHLLGLPAESDLQIDATGDGPLSTWKGSVTATLDRQKLMAVTVSTSGKRAQRDVSFTLDADPRRLVPADIAALLTDGIQARGKLAVDQQAGIIHVQDLQAAGAGATLSAVGTLGLEAPGDLTFTLATGNATPYAAFLPEIGWQQIDLQGKLTGLIAAPEIAANGTVVDLTAAGQKIGFTDLSVTAQPVGTFADGIDLDALINLSEITLDDARLQPLLADGARLGLQGRVDLTGKADIQNIDVHAGPLTLYGTAQAEGWGASSVHAEIEAKAEDLAAWTGPDLPSLHGNINLSLRADKDAAGAKIDVTGEGEALSLGIAAIDGLIGDSPTLSLQATQDSAGNVDLKEASFKGRNATLAASGTLKDDRLDITLASDLTDLSILDPAAAGAVSLAAKLTGNAASPQVAGTLTSRRVTYDQIVVTALSLQVEGQDLLAAPKLALTGKAVVDGQQTSLKARVTQQVADGSIAVRDAQLRFGRSSLGGQVDLIDGLVAGRLALDVPALAELQRLTGIDLAGALNGDIKLSHAGGKQNLSLGAKALGFSYGTMATVAQADVTAQIGDVMGKPIIDSRVDLAGVEASGEKLDKVSLTAKGALDDLALAAQAQGPDIAFETAAHVTGTAENLIATISSLTANYKQEEIALAKPATITRQGEALHVNDLDLRLRDGQVTLEASLAPTGNDVDLQVKQLPLALLKLVDPGIDTVGTIDATLTLNGPRRDPVAQFTVTGKDMGLRGQRGISASVDLKGDWRDGRVETQGQFTFSSGGGLDLAATMGLPADPATGFPRADPAAVLQASAKGTLDLSILDIVLAGGADRVSGKADVDLLANGTLAQPDLSGSIRLQDGRYENVRYGIKLRQIMAELRGNGQRIDLVSLSALTPGGGSVSGQGHIELGLTDAGNAMPLEISLQLDKAQVLNMTNAFAVADAKLQVTGDLADRVTLAGKIKLLKSEIRIPDNLPPSIQEIETVEINLPPERAAEMETAAKPPAKALGIVLDIDVDIPQRMAIRGRGLDAEMEGGLKITGTADQPIINGAINMRRGMLDLVGRQLTFTRGQVIFDGAEKIDPVLDFLATAQTEGYDVSVNVGGHVSMIKIGLSSAPPLPEDEILSRLLFGKSSGSLSAFEAIQLAQATAELAGVGSGTNFLDKIRKKTGLDRLSVDSGDSTTGPSLGAGRYVSEGVYVGVKQGTAGNSSAATVELEVTPNVKVEGEVGANSTGKAGVYWEWNY